MKRKKMPLIVLAASLFIGGGLILNHSIENDNVAVAQAASGDVASIIYTESTSGSTTSKKWDFTTSTSKDVQFAQDDIINGGLKIVHYAGTTKHSKNGFFQVKAKDKIGFPVESGSSGSITIATTSTSTKIRNVQLTDDSAEAVSYTGGSPATISFTASDLVTDTTGTYVVILFTGGDNQVATVDLSYTVAAPDPDPTPTDLTLNTFAQVTTDHSVLRMVGQVDLANIEIIDYATIAYTITGSGTYAANVATDSVNTTTFYSRIVDSTGAAIEGLDGTGDNTVFFVYSITNIPTDFEGEIRFTLSVTTNEDTPRTVTGAEGVVSYPDGTIGGAK